MIINRLKHRECQDEVPMGADAHQAPAYPIFGPGAQSMFGSLTVFLISHILGLPNVKMPSATLDVPVFD